MLKETALDLAASWTLMNLMSELPYHITYLLSTHYLAPLSNKPPL